MADWLIQRQATLSNDPRIGTWEDEMLYRDLKPTAGEWAAQKSAEQAPPETAHLKRRAIRWDTVEEFAARPTPALSKVDKEGPE